jgi:hypothetical protein
MDSIKAVATFKMSGQISPDDWETWTCALEVDENTTIGQIFEWMKTKNGRFEKPDFHITPLDRLAPHIKREDLLP